jgi:DNA (cytosine-5)-methyltransferase 1
MLEKIKTTPPTVVDLFSGIGGLSEGFKKAGFSIVTASEIDPDLASIYTDNNPGTRMILGDIRETKKKVVDSVAGRKVDIVIGGFPCQSYSISGFRDPADPRGDLYKEFLGVVADVKPRFFVGENVKGILTSIRRKPGLDDTTIKKYEIATTQMRRLKDLRRKKLRNEMTGDDDRELDAMLSRANEITRFINKLSEPVMTQVERDARSIGYKIIYKILNSADYGVPQERERVIIIGGKEKIGMSIFPDRTHYPRSMIDNRHYQVESLVETPKKFPYISVKDAIGDLERSGEDINSSHVFTEHSPRFLEKIVKTKPGESALGYGEAFYRLIAEKPSPTCKENHGGVFIHYSQDRLISPREMARLQSFDDSFTLHGKKSKILVGLGNAVPPLLSFAVAKKLS